MIRILFLISLITYSVVVSQPLFYLVAMGGAQRALSAAAYIELRQRINALMTRRLPAIYLSTLIAVVAALSVSLWVGNAIGSIAAGTALGCLVADVALMLRKNVPINGVIDQWSMTDYPADWESYRARWSEGFAYRQVALLVGYAALLVGGVYH